MPQPIGKTGLRLQHTVKDNRLRLFHTPSTHIFPWQKPHFHGHDISRETPFHCLGLMLWYHVNGLYVCAMKNAIILWNKLPIAWIPPDIYRTRRAKHCVAQTTGTPLPPNSSWAHADTNQLTSFKSLNWIIMRKFYYLLFTLLCGLAGTTDSSAGIKVNFHVDNA